MAWIIPLISVIIEIIKLIVQMRGGRDEKLAAFTSFGSAVLDHVEHGDKKAIHQFRDNLRVHCHAVS